MKTKNKTRQREVGIIWFILGLILVSSDNAGGWLFFIIGLVWMSSTFGKDGSWTDQQPKLARWVIAGLFALTMLSVIATLILKKS